MKKFLRYWFIDEENPKKYLLDILIALMILISIALIFFQNKNGDFPKSLQFLDVLVLFFFITEYCIRFYICSDFRKDVRIKGIGFALKQKLRWMALSSSMIDLLAILPSLGFFRGFRALRFFRFLRLFRLIKAFKTFREIDKLNIILQGMKEHNRLFYIFFTATLFILLILSFGLYSAEHHGEQGNFSTFSSSFWYSLELIELADTTPKTILGKILSAILLVFNMAVFGFFISIILNKITQVMNAIASGKISNLNIKNHIVICGYSKSSEKVIKDLLKDKKHCNKVVLVTKKPVEDKDGLIYVNADYTDFNTLKLVKIKRAKFAIIFAEFNEHDTIRDVDLRTVMTIFHIEKEAPDIHTIAEINDEVNATIIKDKIKGDEILYKEMIDAKIITTCISNPNITDMFYELFGDTKERIKSVRLSELGMNRPSIIKNVKLHFIERNETLLGVIDKTNASTLSPRNDMMVDDSYRLIYLS
ncbi:ion transporter [Maribacter sp. 2-571]|uniref:ion transporter n=1 Tax=Maribacter sp. 2-571 TaxID=3417569 RepID=UPI003D32F0C5